MNGSPLVSVIVPSYNHEAFVFESLDSIYAQTYRAIELIVVDDASSDETYNCVSRFLTPRVRKRFANVEVIRNDLNMGAHHTLNVAVQISKGEIISVANSDDLYARDRLEVVLDAMLSQRSALFFTLVDAFGTLEDAQHSSKFRCLAARQLMESARDPTIGFALMRKNLAISTGNLVFSRRLFDQVGGFIRLSYCHDWDFVLQSVRFTEPVLVRERLYRYRLHGSNSYKALAAHASTESEIVLRRFFRAGLIGTVTNELCPCERNWPAAFTSFVDEMGAAQFLSRERGLGLKSWRTLNKTEGAASDATSLQTQQSQLFAHS
jgi:glycosyltransferase involved in cell wall biosynthesis